MTDNLSTEEIRDAVFCDDGGLWVRDALGNCRPFDIHDYESLVAELEEVKGFLHQVEDGLTWNSSTYQSFARIEGLFRERKASRPARATQAEQAQDREITALREALERWVIARKTVLTLADRTSAAEFKVAFNELSEAEWALAALSTNHKTGEV